MGNGGLLDSISVFLPCLDVLMIHPHPQPVCVVDDLFIFLIMRNLVYAKFLLYLRRITAVEQEMLLLLCYQTVSAGFEMLTGYESSFILQNECSWVGTGSWITFFFFLIIQLQKEKKLSKRRGKKFSCWYFEAPLLHSFQVICYKYSAYMEIQLLMRSWEQLYDTN